MKRPIISVIVPVYNTEKYLDECIQSILSQTFTDFELLLVDDGSTDGSGNICDKYAIQDERIKVFHQENRGVTAARKLGVKYSNGNYICFVDSDDKISYTAFELLIHNMKDEIDIVISDVKFEGVIAGKDYVNKLLCGKMPVALWGKLYRRNIFQNTGVFDLNRNINIGEDWWSNIKIALLVRNVACLSISIYDYCDNPTSVMHINKTSLEYEERYRIAIEEMLGENKNQYEESWYKFQLHLLEKLITQKIKFSYNRPWIQNLFKGKYKYSFSVRERVVYYIHNAVLCYYILMLISLLRHYFRFLCVDQNKKILDH